jgi:hypothetical protein
VRREVDNRSRVAIDASQPHAPLGHVDVPVREHGLEYRLECRPHAPARMRHRLPLAHRHPPLLETAGVPSKRLDAPSLRRPVARSERAALDHDEDVVAVDDRRGVVHQQVISRGGGLLAHERIHDHRRQHGQHWLATDRDRAGVLRVVTKLWPRSCEQEGSGDWYIHAAIL